jgi:uncharacterized protein involved in exopolysaccharide biosynthesis
VVGDLPGDLLTLQTEAAKMGSLTVALRAVDKLGLVDDPRFNPNLAPPPMDPGFSLSSLFEDSLVLLGLKEATAEPAPATAPQPPAVQIEDPEKLREVMAARFMGGLSIQTADRSRILTIAYISTDPVFAARAANAVAFAYIEGQLERIGDETSRAGEAVSEKLAALELELLVAERKLEEFRAKHGNSWRR